MIGVNQCKDLDEADIEVENDDTVSIDSSVFTRIFAFLSVTLVSCKYNNFYWQIFIKSHISTGLIGLAVLFSLPIEVLTS